MSCSLFGGVWGKDYFVFFSSVETAQFLGVQNGCQSLKILFAPLITATFILSVLQ